MLFLRRVLFNILNCTLKHNSNTIVIHLHNSSKFIEVMLHNKYEQVLRISFLSMSPRWEWDVCEQTWGNVACVCV